MDRGLSCGACCGLRSDLRGAERDTRRTASRRRAEPTPSEKGLAVIHGELDLEFRAPTNRTDIGSSSGEVVVVDPSKPGEGSGSLTSILHNVITDVAVEEEVGSLVLDLMDGTRIEVAQDGSYEA
jgi:hypothetical protein